MYLLPNIYRKQRNKKSEKKPEQNKYEEKKQRKSPLKTVNHLNLISMPNPLSKLGRSLLASSLRIATDLLEQIKSLVWAREVVQNAAGAEAPQLHSECTINNSKELFNCKSIFYMSTNCTQYIPLLNTGKIDLTLISWYAMIWACCWKRDSTTYFISFPLYMKAIITTIILMSAICSADAVRYFTIRQGNLVCAVDVHIRDNGTTKTSTSCFLK